MTTPAPVLKAHAYVTRGDELLVFTHRDHPRAGTQVPGGGVAANEAPEAAVLRELREESGLTAVRIERLLEVYERERAPRRTMPGTADDPVGEEDQRRHAFHLTLTGDVPDSWDHTVHGGGEDNGLVFRYAWLPLDEAEARLWPIQARVVPLLRTAVQAISPRAGTR